MNKMMNLLEHVGTNTEAGEPPAFFFAELALHQIESASWLTVTKRTWFVTCNRDDPTGELLKQSINCHTIIYWAAWPKVLRHLHTTDYRPTVVLFPAWVCSSNYTVLDNHRNIHLPGL